jgi:nicotinamide mononucleotide transporter
MIRFCHNHGLIRVLNRPQWHTVRGGSREYVRSMLARIPDARLNTPVLAVRRLPRMGWPAVLISGMIGSAVLALLLAQTDAAAPMTDGAVAGWSLVAQVLINLRMLESWPLWVGINIVSVGLYASQALWVTAALYVVFLAVSIWSWRLWLAAERG